MVMFGGLFENTVKGQVRWSRSEKTRVPMQRRFRRRFRFLQTPSFNRNNAYKI